MRGFFIAGTDTDVGKTVAAAWAQLHYDGVYWKPVQAGPDNDRNTVQAITGFADDRFLPSVYELSQPLSPHEAARRDGVTIDMDAFRLTETERPLIVEGAGGLLVPLTSHSFVIDLAARLGLPVLLVCRSGLGTINHTLLSLEALRRRKLDVAGLIISGPKTPHNREALQKYGHANIIAEIDQLEPLTKDTLLAVKPEIKLV